MSDDAEALELAALADYLKQNADKNVGPEIIIETASWEYIAKARIRFVKKCKWNHETGCIEWCGSKDANGYGKFKFKDQLIYARRMALMFTEDFQKAADPDYNQPIGSDNKRKKITITSTCGNKSCVNPEHLKICQSETK